MDSVDEIMQLCRLCLVKDEVNTPIFEEEGDIRQIFLKISACLPVKVSKEDNLPKNICDGCSCKLEALYQFWNTSANSEKKLMKWLSQGGIIDKSVSDKHSMNIDPVILKQEVVEVPDDRHSPDDDLVSSDLNVSNDADEYLIQQQQLPYQNVEFQFQQDEFDQTGTDPIIAETGTPSRKRRAAAIRAMANMGTEEEANPDLLEPKIAKTEEESEDSCNEDPEPTTFVGLPSATDNEQAGPSGVGKPAADPPDVSDEDGLMKHANYVHKKEPTHSCRVCGKIFTHPNPMIFTCLECNQQLTSKMSLQREIGGHRKDHCFVCDTCGKSIKTITTFRTHLRIHSGEKPFECHECDKKFSAKQRLKEHLRVHTKEKPYACDVCPKRFSQCGSLKIHLRKHTGDRPYVCSICEKAFVVKTLLVSHMKVHDVCFKVS